MEPTLQNILDQSELKWVFVGGKGGVGKTTCSCSLAVQLAKVRENVLIISTDPAHNLSDAFRQRFSRSPTLVNGFTNLYAMEIDPNKLDDGAEDFLNQSQEDNFLNDLTSSIPGIDEAMSFGEVMRMIQHMDYSCVIFDTAPTGHTLRLLQLPSTIQKGLDKVLSLQGGFGDLIRQFSSFFSGSNSDDSNQSGGGSLLSRLEQLKNIVEEVNSQFKRPDLTTFICVCIPEFLSLYETERMIQELAKFEMDVHNIIINQVIFKEEAVGCRLLEARVKLQEKYLEQYNELYNDFHLVKLPLVDDEVRGKDKIVQFSENLIVPYDHKNIN